MSRNALDYDKIEKQMFAVALQSALRREEFFVRRLVGRTHLARKDGLLTRIISVDTLLELINRQYERAEMPNITLMGKEELLHLLRRELASGSMIELLPERYVLVRMARDDFKQRQTAQQYCTSQLKDCEWYHAFYLVFHRVLPLKWPDKRICACVSPSHNQFYIDDQRQTITYNDFVTAELAKFKAEHPEVCHPDAFSIVIDKWRDLKHGRKRRLDDLPG